MKTFRGEIRLLKSAGFAHRLSCGLHGMRLDVKEGHDERRAKKQNPHTQSPRRFSSTPTTLSLQRTCSTVRILHGHVCVRPRSFPHIQSRQASASDLDYSRHFVFVSSGSWTVDRGFTPESPVYFPNTLVGKRHRRRSNTLVGTPLSAIPTKAVGCDFLVRLSTELPSGPSGADRGRLECSDLSPLARVETLE